MSEYEDTDPLSDVRKMIAEGKKIDEDINKIVEAGKEEAEREIMMGLWGYLGDGTEDYHESFRGAAAYTEIITVFRDAIKNLDFGTKKAVSEAMSKQIASDLMLYSKLEEVKDKYSK